MPNYRFLWKPEILWSLFVAAIVAAAGALSGITPEQLADPSVVVMIVAAAVGRAVLAALMARFGPGGFGESKPEGGQPS